MATMSITNRIHLNGNITDLKDNLSCAAK